MNRKKAIQIMLAGCKVTNDLMCSNEYAYYDENFSKPFRFMNNRNGDQELRDCWHSLTWELYIESIEERILLLEERILLII